MTEHSCRLVFRLAGLLLAGLILDSCATLPVTAKELASHRAHYNIRLAKTAQGAGLVAARGVMTMVFEKSCEGWVLRQQMSMTMETSDGQTIEQETRFGGLESFDGLKYRFGSFSGALQNKTNYRGEAVLAKPGAGGQARYVEPEATTFDLPAGTMFPASHTQLLIEEAKKGKKILVGPLFDGTEGKGAEEVSAVIGPLRKAGAFKLTIQDPLVNQPGWFIRMAVFDIDQQDPAPSYEMGFIQLENGVSPYLEIDYADFSLVFELQKLEALPAPHC